MTRFSALGEWTHAICERCWAAREGDRSPVTLGENWEQCCFCGASTRGGIFVRADPSTVLYGGSQHSGDKGSALAVLEAACPVCSQIGAGFGPSHDGSPLCRCGSLASGGHRAHCSCDTCF